MKIPVQDILPTQPKVLQFEGKEPFLREILARLVADELAAKTVATRPATDAISANVTLTRDGRTVFVSGGAHATIHVPCARCLKSLTLDLDPQIELSLLPAVAPDEGSEIELHEGDFDDFTYSDDVIDVGAILNEQLLLEKPVKVVCSEDCKGLCPTCGRELNEAACHCVEQPKALAFAALKDFKPSH